MRSTRILALALAAAGCADTDLTLPEASPGTIQIVRHTPAPSDVGRAVLFEVELGAARGGGTNTLPIEIRTSSGESCTGNDRDLQCEIVFNSPGTRSVTARYPGDASYDAAESEPITHVVNDVPDPTRTIIGVGPDPSPAGAPVTVYITVRADGDAPGRGRVEVYGPGTSRCGDGPHAGGVELDGDGKGTITVTGLPEGWHYFRGCFTGSPGYSPSEDGASVTIQ